MDDLENRVRELVHEQISWLPLDMPLETDVIKDIYGDDVHDLLEEFSKRFNVTMTGYKWYHHTGEEGCNPLWLLFRPWWSRMKYVPMTLSTLVESARQGVWSIEYPVGAHAFRK